MSDKARKLYEHIASRVGPDNLWAEKRADVIRALGFSPASLTRALGELKDLGILEVVRPGGGAGRSTVYRFHPPEAEVVSEEAGEIEGESSPSGEEAGVLYEAPEHVQGEAEHVQGDLPSFWELGVECGGKVVGFVGGVIEGAVDRFLGFPKPTQALILGLAGIGVGLLVAKSTGAEGKEACLPYALLGGVAGVGLAALIPSRGTEKLYYPTNFPNGGVRPPYPGARLPYPKSVV